MADPLSLLRQYNINNRLDEIYEKDNIIVFGDIGWNKDEETNYLLWGTGKSTGTPKEYYKLDCILFLLQNVKKSHPKYVKDAAKENISVVRRPDRRELLGYLNGETNTSSSIDRTAQVKIPIQVKKINSEQQCKIQKTFYEQQDLLKDKERLSAWLDAPKEAQLFTQNLRSLSDTMSVEKIAQIKAKRLAKKRSSIKVGGIEQVLSQDASGGAGADIDSDNINLDGKISSRPKTIASSFVDSEVNATKAIISRQREYRNRSSFLQSSGEALAKSVFPLLQLVKLKEQGGGAGQESEKVPLKTVAKPMNSNSTLPSTQLNSSIPQYSRYYQERFKPNKDIGEFKIDTMGSYHGLTLNSITNGNDSSSQQQQPSLRRTSNSTSLSHPSSNALPPSTNSSTKDSSRRSSSSDGIRTSQKRVSRTPIIIIPATTSSLITMLNAKDILQDFKFTNSDEKRRQGCVRENDVLIQRVKDPNSNIRVPYRIIDNPSKLSSDDWNRVVAVFVQGALWQFKGWPWNENPVEIFARELYSDWHCQFIEGGNKEFDQDAMIIQSNTCKYDSANWEQVICLIDCSSYQHIFIVSVKGFHLKWDLLKLDANVGKWDVHVIELSRDKKYLHRAAFLKFWEILDKYTSKSKPYLKT